MFSPVLDSGCGSALSVPRLAIPYRQRHKFRLKLLCAHGGQSVKNEICEFVQDAVTCPGLYRGDLDVRCPREHLFEALGPIGAANRDALFDEEVLLIGQNDMSLAIHFEDCFMKKDVGAAGGRRIPEPCVRCSERLLNRAGNSLFELRRKSRYSPVRPIDHMSGKNDDGWNF